MKFQRGLHPSILVHIVALRLSTFADVVEIAMVVGRESGELQRIRDQEKKCPCQDEFRKSNDNTMTIKKVVTETRTPLNRVGCPHYRKAHVGVCHLQTGACFRCKKVGHMIRDWPMMKNE